MRLAVTLSFIDFFSCKFTALESSYNTKHADSGVDVVDVSKMPGHGDIKTTLIDP